jgi:hypothetical protein
MKTWNMGIFDNQTQSTKSSWADFHPFKAVQLLDPKILSLSPTIEELSSLFECKLVPDSLAVILFSS